MCDVTYVTGTNFLREDMVSYIRHQGSFCGISGVQDNAKCLTNIVETFQQGFY